MSVKIKLKRLGKIRLPQYRIVVMDSRKKRDGRAIEEIGLYHPKEDPSFIQVDSDRVQYWLGVGAQPTDAVAAILKITGDWQKFKGLPGQEGTLKVKEAKEDRVDAFEKAVADAEVAKGEPKLNIVVKSEQVEEDAPAEEVASEDAPAAEEPAAEDAPAEEAATEEVSAEEVPAVEEAKEEAPADETPAEEESKDA